MTENGHTQREQAQASSEDGQTPTPEAEAAAGEVETQAAPGGDDALAEALQREVELKDRLLRALADIDNMRRRNEKEKADAIQYGIQRFASALVHVADSLQRATQGLSPELRAELPEQIRNLVMGVELTEKELMRAFEQHGIKIVNPKDERFDPHLHQAISQIPVPTVPDGTVVNVAQVGYTIGDRLLRPAMVIVATGGPKQNGAPSSTTDNAVDTSA